ncbi:LysE family translocator [Motiliproteus sp. MSK22-1]|uniref:LysE family translocator n=1 Tax=Motiliproteus sp. MSK22-1 TaxID=1897630 RepID=UPI0009776E49|nr:LysE family translocator [Motiliproteus sp. MSK22-1]OMH25844.1 lysine transporter LysE [Motiliproteus sp. MSK22-1]
MEMVVLALFIPACFALNMAPGPNNLIALSNAKRYGFRIAFFAGLGRLTAFALMIALAASGLAVVLHTSETLFLIIKIFGAAYLFWLAIQLWRAGAPADTELRAQQLANVPLLMRQEFLLAAGNPKAILIFTAFLPQFISPTGNIELQFGILGGLFLILEWTAIACYALAGVYLASWFSHPRYRQRFNRGCAGLLASAGIGMLVSGKGS